MGRLPLAGHLHRIEIGLCAASATSGGSPIALQQLDF
jgi:hypothetical protein